MKNQDCGATAEEIILSLQESLVDANDECHRLEKEVKELNKALAFSGQSVQLEKKLAFYIEACAAHQRHIDELQASFTAVGDKLIETEKERDALLLRTESPGCFYACAGRGDCAHFVGLPGRSIPGQHDGQDDTVDHYGKPNGWCWSCWKDYKLKLAEDTVASYDRQDELIGTESEGVDEVTDVIRILKDERDEARAALCREQEKPKLEDEKQVRENIAYLVTVCNKKTELLRAVRHSMDSDKPFPSLEKITEAINL